MKKCLSGSSAAAGLAAAVFANTLWGVLPLYWALLGRAGSVELLCHRIVWSLLFLFAVFACTGRLGTLARETRRVFAGREGAVLLLAAAFAAANWLINILGVVLGRVVELGIGLFLTPLMTVALGLLIFRERASRARLAALVLAAAGVILMVSRLTEFPFIALGVSSSWAVYGVLKRLVRIDSWSSIAIEHALMFPFALAFILWLAASGGGHFLAGEGWMFDAEILLLGVVTSVPMVAFSFAAQHISFAILGITQYLIPLLTLLLGVFVFREPVGAERILPLAFIWGAVALYIADSVRQARLPRP